MSKPKMTVAEKEAQGIRSREYYERQCNYRQVNERRCDTCLNSEFRQISVQYGNGLYCCKNEFFVMGNRVCDYYEEIIKEAKNA